MSMIAAKSLVMLILKQWSAEQENAFSKLLQEFQADDWHAFFRLIRRNSLSVSVFHFRERWENKVPVNFRNESNTFYQGARELLLRETARFAWVVKVAKVHHEQAIPFLVLKGTAVGCDLMGSPFYKRMNDLDYLVPPEYAEKSIAAVKSLGFQSVGPLLGKAEYSAKSHHAPPFFQSDLSCVLGIHWGLVSRERTEKPSLEKIWAEAISFDQFGLRAQRMCWEHQLLHLCIHLPEYKLGLKELGDLLQVVLFVPQFNWSNFLTAAREWKAESSAYRALKLVDAIFPGSVPASVLVALVSRVSRRDRKAVDALAAYGPLLIQYRTLHISKLEKAFAQSWLSPNPRTRYRAWKETWKLLFNPPLEDANALLRTEIKGKLSYSQRMRAANAAWRGLTQEHGTLKVTIGTVLNIFSALKTRFFLAVSPQLKENEKEHPAEGLLQILE